MRGNKLNTPALTAPDTSLSRLAPKTGAERGPVVKPDAADHHHNDRDEMLNAVGLTKPRKRVKNMTLIDAFIERIDHLEAVREEKGDTYSESWLIPRQLLVDLRNELVQPTLFAGRSHEERK
jgi:hypothetical protein